MVLMHDPVASFFQFVSEDAENTIAVKGHGYSVSYKELMERVKQIAGSLVALPEVEKVALLLPQGFKAYGSMLASLAAGKYYCPINIETPSARISNILEEFSPDIILYCQETEDLAKSISPQFKRQNIDNIHGVEPLKHPRKPHSLAYVIFTSGSTGTPKGVMLGSKGLGKYLGWAKKALSITKGSIVSQHPNIGFDLSVLDIFATLCSGGTLVPIIGIKYRVMPAMAIKEHQITHWISVPSVIDLINKSKQLNEDYLSSIKTVLFCGEPLFEYQVSKLFLAKPSIKVINTYGPTEATVSCTQVELSLENYLDHCYDEKVTIGKAIEGVSLNLYEEDNGKGELFISGEQVALGYWRDQTKTDQSFRIDSSSPRAYRTGDIVQLKNDQLYFVQRNDKQIKIKGYRVELTEIDSVLRQQGFDTCITLYKNNKLYSFIETEVKLENKHILEKLARILPDYMLPNKLIGLESFPLNSNDKVDTKKLIENYVND
ncbi:MAG: AMP-binding protein [Colwellia sp.]|nr:AMP-binding protein [Colwellia sp.]NQZ80654.1 AMP-binding protein [Colwellia sp.]